MTGLKWQMLMVPYINQQNQLLGYQTLFTGPNITEVHLRKIVKHALYFNALAVIFAHDEPSGEITPSHVDKMLTQRLVNILQLMDIRELDPSVGCRHIFSVAEQGPV